MQQMSPTLGNFTAVEPGSDVRHAVLTEAQLALDTTPAAVKAEPGVTGIAEEATAVDEGAASSTRAAASASRAALSRSQRSSRALVSTPGRLCAGWTPDIRELKNTSAKIVLQGD